MRLALCVAVKNRSCVIVDKEDSLSFLRHVDIEDCSGLKIDPWYTKKDQIALPLLPKMLRSFVSHKKPEDDWVLVVVDYKSSDVDMKQMLEYEVGEKMSWHLEIVQDYDYFDRGGGLKKAFEIADTKFKADAIFFCDADLLFGTRDVLDRAIETVSKHRFYYPIVYSFALPDHTKGFWRDSGFGIFACLVEDYKQTEGWQHNISWGWEDRALADSIPPHQKIREKVPGYFHQWHPFQWEFRVKEYPVKQFVFRDAVRKELKLE
jgi:hypothetical protein